jgi:hypothetical protein
VPVPVPPEILAEMAGYTERELLLLIIEGQYDQGVIMSRLDEVVTNYVTEVDATVADLRQKLTQAQADDASAADVAADVEENIARIETASAALRGETGGEPTDPDAPVDGGTPVDGGVQPV